ncbi:hypothetical protein ACLQ2Q_11590 [Microbacterium sp. DT81.1]|uniref:hypothetical protein n=1 Tax=Microbacterium sp. DT81.1 TaxID=3393413 RepID=UPI003CEAAD58
MARISARIAVALLAAGVSVASSPLSPSAAEPVEFPLGIPTFYDHIFYGGNGEWAESVGPNLTEIRLDVERPVRGESVLCQFF